MVRDAMSQPKPPTPRYTLRRATLEIAEVLRVRGRGSRKEVALGIGLNEQAFSAKMRGVYTSLSIEEIGQIAAYLDAPTGWPWVPWSEGERMDAAVPRSRKT